MRHLLLTILASLALCPPPATADLGPCATVRTQPFTGTFYFWYQETHCRQAPCPKSRGLVVSLIVKPPGLQSSTMACTLDVSDIAFAPGTPAGLRLKPSSTDSERRFAVYRGAVFVARRRAVARIAPESAHFSATLPPRS